jgi:four helix bundle protein
MSMNAEEMKNRTKSFSLRAIQLVNALPKSSVARVLGDQLLRSATSVAANYRAACKGRSRAEFIAKLGTVEEESDECQLWIELIGDAGLIQKQLLASLLSEAKELTAIVAASRKSAFRNRHKEKKSS